MVVSNGPAFDAPWMHSVGKHVYAVSFHAGYDTQPVEFTAASVTACTKYPLTTYLPLMADLRSALNASNLSNVLVHALWKRG